MKKALFMLMLTLTIFMLMSCDKNTSSKEPTHPITESLLTEAQTPTESILPSATGTLVEPTEQTQPTDISKEPTEVSYPTEINNDLLTEEVYVDDFYYDGNTNGNLNNRGLVVYSYDDKLHYFSMEKGIYSFDPESMKKSLIYELIEGRPTYLNISKDALFFINSNNGFVLKLNLKTQEITNIIETECIYLNVDDNYIYTLQHTDYYGESRVNYFCYRLNNYTLVKQDFSVIEFMNIYSRVIYFLENQSFTLRLMNYNGQGKTTVSYLDEEVTDEIFELIMYRKKNNTHYYLMIATINKEKGLYHYNSEDKELVKLLDGDLNSLNYHSESIFLIKENGIIEIPFITMTPKVIYKELDDHMYLQVVNRWLYIGKKDGSKLYQYHPVTKRLTIIQD